MTNQNILAARIESHGDPSVITFREEPIPYLAAGMVLIKQKACSVNFIDLHHRNGSIAVPLPHGLGVEGTGMVVEVGDAVSQVRPGDRVAYIAEHPCAYAQMALVPEHEVIKVPEALSLIDIAAVFRKGLTALSLLDHTVSINPDSKIYLTAGSGGLGLLLCQYARYRGIELIATASTEEKCQLMKHYGARFVINYKKEMVVDRVMEYTNGRGVNVVLDSCGSATFRQSLKLLRPLGTFISFGGSQGFIPPLDIRELENYGSIKLTCVSVVNYIGSSGRYREMSETLFSLLLNGDIVGHVGQKYSLEQAAIAHRDIEERKTLGATLLEF